VSGFNGYSDQEEDQERCTSFPGLALKVFSIRSRRMIESQARELGLDKMAREISLVTGSTVAFGPFAGMTLNYELLPVHASPKERSSLVQDTS
jgi:hypothetical protein